MAEISIVGRDREIGRLTAAIEEAADGRGSVWYLTGEPGIGKSFLAEAVADLARRRGMRTFWGRCWEAGGAPAYWPWVQVLRGVLRTTDPERIEPHLDELSQLLPEVVAVAPTLESGDLGPNQARFRLMDAVSSVLAEAAQRLPLVIVLEDLHVADVSTVLLLEFLSSSVRHQPLLIVGTFREAELASAPARMQLVRAAHQGQRLPLERLTERDVATFLESSGEEAAPAFVHALHRTTEGHPLFLVETARLWRAQGKSVSEASVTIPRTVRTAIQQRLTTVSPECVRALQCGAIVGREFDIGLLVTCHGDGPYAESAQEAADASILVEIAPQRYRFAHFLIREVVYESIDESVRAASHARLARILESRNDGEAPWSEIAHHLAAAGEREEAARAYRRAGSQALRQLAFDEAVIAYEAALRALDDAEGTTHGDRAELLLALAHAKTRAGHVTAGKADCVATARLARESGNAALLARAALEHGRALRYAQIDEELIALLDEALRALGPADSSLRARVMARLAAAKQPAEDPEGPMELARAAIEMARRLDDPETLLDTLRNGGSAMVDLGDLDERMALHREHAALAEDLENPVEALRANMRSVMDFLELERLDDAYRAMRACERITDELGHPAYTWRSIALKSLRALWEGELDTAERLIESIRSLAERADPNAMSVYTMQKIRLFQYQGELDAQLPLLAEVERQLGRTEMGLVSARIIVCAEHVTAGRVRDAQRAYDGESFRRLLRLGDRTLELALARLSIAAEDRDLAALLHKRLLLTREHLVTGGMIYMTLEGPTSWGLAMLACFLERTEEAEEHYEHALDVARRTGGRPVQALLALEYAQLLSKASDPGSRSKATELARLAERIATEVGMPVVLSESRRLTSGVALGEPDVHDTPASTPTLSMTPVGDSWLLSYGNVEFHLKDVRGVRLLAQLVDEPGREFHVLDLSREGKTQNPVVDRGDRGEALDEEARRQYRARVVELRADLDEAESWNDSGRAERAREELAFIERELTRAIGLGGRERRAGSASERARVNVQRRIRDAIRRIESYHPGLAKHLDRSIRTGTYCAYEP